MHSPYKLVAFDVDGTLVETEMWVRLHTLFGTSREQDLTWLRQYIAGEISFKEWMKLLEVAWKPARKTKSEIQAVFHKMKFIPYAEDLVSHLQGNFHLALISSGFGLYVSEVAQRLHIPHAYFLNTFNFDGDGYFESIGFTTELSESEAKVEALKDLEKRYKLEPNEIVFVGDSKNDLGAFEHTGNGILFGDGDENLRNIAWKQVQSLDEIKAVL